MGYRIVWVYVLQVSAEGSVRTELITDDGESRYKITDIIGRCSHYCIMLYDC